MLSCRFFLSGNKRIKRKTKRSPLNLATKGSTCFNIKIEIPHENEMDFWCLLIYMARLANKFLAKFVCYKFFNNFNYSNLKKNFKNFKLYT